MKIGRFEVLEELGRGGMGVVYRAFDPTIGRAVAIKKLTHASEDALLRFRQEAFAAGRLQHPNITTVFESGDEQREPFLVMEFLDGESLKARMRSDTLPPIEDRLRVVAEVALGLAHAHANGVAAHRDIKPANIQLTASGIAKVMDFGIAKLADDLMLARSLTEANTVLGTLFYMSPEQIRGEKLDGRSDIWSLGVVLWELLWQTRPFEHEDDNEVMKMIVLDDLPEPESLAVHEEAELVRIVRHALEKDRDKRYRDASDLAHDLERVIASMRDKRGQPVPSRERTAEEYFEEGHRFFETGALGRAADAFRRALELAPDSRSARKNLEACLVAQEKKHREELYSLGVLLFKNREYSLAISVLEELVAADSSQDDARTLIVWARRELLRNTDKGPLDAMVESTLQELLRDDPDLAPAVEPQEVSGSAVAPQQRSRAECESGKVPSLPAPIAGVDSESGHGEAPTSGRLGRLLRRWFPR